VITVRWGQSTSSEPTRRVVKTGPDQTVTTAHPRPHRWSHFKPSTRGQVRLSQPRYGAATTTEESQELWGYSAPGEIIHHPYFGLTVVSCERGAIRQSPDGLVVYGQNGLQEIPVARTMRGRAAELAELHRAITEDRPVQHDGRWGRATLEVCFAILQSAYEDREVVLSHQVSL